MGQICWFFILEFYGKGNIESNFSTAVVQQRHRWFNLHPPWIMKFPDTQNGHIQYRLMGLVDFTLQFQVVFCRIYAAQCSIHGIPRHLILLARSLSQAVRSRWWKFQMSKFLQQPASQWRRQTSTEVSKIKVFLQRVEQENNQITQNQKNIGTKKQQYTHLKKNMFYM